MPKLRQYTEDAEEDCRKMVKAYVKISDILEKAAKKSKDSALKQAISYLVEDVIVEEIEFWAGEDEGLDYPDLD